jgi:hypothetical protein
VVDLGGRIELDVELPGHEPRDRLLELGDPVVGITPVLRPADFRDHCLANRARSHLVVFPNAEIDQRSCRVLGQGLPLGPLDLLELVDLRALAVVGTADPLGKELLKIGVRHGSFVRKRAIRVRRNR